MATNCKRNFIILAMIFVSLATSKADVISAIKDTLFPVIEVTLANDGDYPVYLMCKFTNKDKYLHTLDKGEIFRYNFTQYAFPMRWCYLYVDENSHGFFWAYNVRLRCTKCFWSISNYPYLYRSDRSRWERQKLYIPLGFDVTKYILKAPQAE